mmetsp:Transcript_22074/g.52387  ORF Transcript_22074/g.52387 Transcript_22074/m.52387 type:complete len:223 (+) Transcript_22074:345-1013(+)
MAAWRAWRRARRRAARRMGIAVTGAWDAGILALDAHCRPGVLRALPASLCGREPCLRAVSASCARSTSFVAGLVREVIVGARRASHALHSRPVLACGANTGAVEGRLATAPVALAAIGLRIGPVESPCLRQPIVHLLRAHLLQAFKGSLRVEHGKVASQQYGSPAICSRERQVAQDFTPFELVELGSSRQHQSRSQGKHLDTVDVLEAVPEVRGIPRLILQQ